MIYIATYLRDPEAVGFPFDVGDDPSFAAGQRFGPRGGALTWGVCRQDVRNALDSGDLVIFFAADRLADRRPAPARYCFVGFATVDRKVTQADIWTDDSLAVYRNYRNLVIRPAATGEGWEHFEPEMTERLWHQDWLWRIADTHGLAKNDFKRVQDGGALRPADRIGRRPITLAANYVLFRREDDLTVVLAEPPEVAHATTPGSQESWDDTSMARIIMQVVFSGTRRTLRTTNPQQCHRHIAIDADATERRCGLLRAIHDLQLVRRSSQSGIHPVAQGEPMGTAVRRRRVC
jgi:hypothetical protein